MAYPFVQMPTLDEFVARACSEFGAEVRTTRVAIRGREATEARVLVRIGSKPRVAALPEVEGGDRLTPHVVRSLCGRLEISLKAFGFDLG